MTTNTAAGLISPLGGRLVNLVVAHDERKDAEAAFAGSRKLVLDERELSDIEMMSVGAYSPLDGFMDHGDYQSVLANMRLSTGQPWTIPITLMVDDHTARGIRCGEQVALTDGSGQTKALMIVSDIFRVNKKHEAELVYRSTDVAHPGVGYIYSKGDVAVGGKVRVIGLPARSTLVERRMTPSETRGEFQRRGWQTVVGFQTRNPIHRAHEYIQKCALEIVDGLFIQPLVGCTKPGDTPVDLRMKTYELMLENYYPKERVVLGVLETSMRYAGPREAVFHALIRRNYGCSHFIVGRDHAGVGNYYGPYDAQRIFDDFSSDELGVTPLFFGRVFYCRKCDSMVSEKVCPHGPEFHISLSGTRLREMLQKGEMPPSEITRPEVAKVLMEAYEKLDSSSDGGRSS